MSNSSSKQPFIIIEYTESDDAEKEVNRHIKDGYEVSHTSAHRMGTEDDARIHHIVHLLYKK